jgi:hypothetical protein
VLDRDITTGSGLLLPADAAIYAQAFVNAELPAASLPDGFADKTPNQLADQTVLRSRLAAMAVSNATDFLITSKNVPHGVRELMWIDGSAVYRSAMTQLPESVAHRLLSEAAVFIEATEAQGLYPSVSWSHDPLTKHRVSIQGEKRVHIHGIARDSDEIQKAQESRIELGKLDPVPRRRLMDEFALVGKEIVTDMAWQHDLLTTDVHPGLVTLDMSTERLRKPEFTAKLLEFFRRLDVLYGTVMLALGGESSYGMADRLDPKVLQASFLPDLSQKNLARVSQFIRGLRPIANTTVERLAFSTHKHYAKTVIPLRGLAYSVTIASVQDRLGAHVRFCKFADMGGAGCAIIEGVPTRVVRGRGRMTAEDMETRQEFQMSMVKAIMNKEE